MKVSSKSLFLFIIFACHISAMMAQATKEVFSTAVDHVNCETIRFIHREAGRAEAANNMDCLSFESIYKSIPTDEAGTTGALCKNINDYKTKFKEEKPLDAQLNMVIAFANAKIAAKKRKGNVEDFKASLEKIKKDALDAAKGTASATNSSTATKPAEPTKTEEKTAATTDTSKAISEPVATENTAKTGRKTDWLGLLSLLVGLGALGLAYMAYGKAKKSGDGSIQSSSTTFGNKSTKDESMQEIIRVEKHLMGEIANINRVIDELLKKSGAASQAPTAAPEPIKEEAPIGYVNESTKETQEARAKETERIAEEERAKETERIAEVPKEPEMELVEKPEDVINPSEPELIPKPEEKVAEKETEPESENEQETEFFSPYPISDGEGIEAMSPPAPDLFSAGGVPKQEPKNIQPETQAAPSSMGYSTPGTAVAEPEPFMPEKEYEDGEAVPFYKFAGLPNAEGYFENNSFTDEPSKDSVYEIEMYEDVPDKAFFSIRSNPDIIRRVILDPQTYLAPCCTYTDDPAGKHTIVLVEEGMLRKENNRWVVYEKAKINFE